MRPNVIVGRPAARTILRWLKQPGDSIARDEAIVEISTDKVNAEVPSTAAGRISRLLVAEGDVVEIELQNVGTLRNPVKRLR